MNPSDDGLVETAFPPSLPHPPPLSAIIDEAVWNASLQLGITVKMLPPVPPPEPSEDALRTAELPGKRHRVNPLAEFGYGDLSQAALREHRGWLLGQMEALVETCGMLEKELGGKEEGKMNKKDDNAAAAQTKPLSARGSRPLEWEFALSTASSPKSCLINIEAEEGTKVAGPKGTDKWVTFSQLNKYRRKDPQKLRDLWYGQYDVDFGPINELASTQALAVSAMLDSPVLIPSLVILSIAGALGVSAGALWAVLVRLLNSHLWWRSYGLWSRFLYVSAPFKILLGRWVYSSCRDVVKALADVVRDRLLDLESHLLQASLPVPPEETVPKTQRDKGQEGDQDDQGLEDEPEEEPPEESEDARDSQSSTEQRWWPGRDLWRRVRRQRGGGQREGEDAERDEQQMEAQEGGI